MEDFAEKQAAAQNELQAVKEGANVEDLRDRLTRLTWHSNALSKKDKAEILNWLTNDPGSRDTNALNLRINEFPAAERSVDKQVEAYHTQIQAEVRAGRFRAESIEAYRRWFKEELSYEERAEYLKNKKTDLHNPRRTKVFDQFTGKLEIDGVYIPTAVREEAKREFEKADLAEREALVKRLASRHKQLKESFLQLSPDIQKKYAAEFKSCGLHDREKLLKAITGTHPDAAAAGAEKSEEEKLIKKYEEKTSRFVADDLLTETGKIAYDEWFSSLSVEQKRRMLDGSELDMRKQKRIEVRNRFNALDLKIRAPRETEFRKADLDRRIEILADLTGTGQTGKAKYPEAVVQRTMESTLKDQSLHELRVIHTVLHESQILRRRAEITAGAKKTEDIARKMQERHLKTDEHQIVDLRQLRQHRDFRLRAKKYLVEKRADGMDAKATNMDLLDRNRARINAEQFKELVVNHQKRELVARLVACASQKLPQADPEQLRKIANSMNLTLDLRREAA